MAILIRGKNKLFIDEQSKPVITAIDESSLPVFSQTWR